MEEQTTNDSTNKLEGLAVQGHEMGLSLAGSSNRKSNTMHETEWQSGRAQDEGFMRLGRDLQAIVGGLNFPS